AHRDMKNPNHNTHSPVKHSKRPMRPIFIKPLGFDDSNIRILVHAGAFGHPRPQAILALQRDGLQVTKVTLGGPRTHLGPFCTRMILATSARVTELRMSPMPGHEGIQLPHS